VLKTHLMAHHVHVNGQVVLIRFIPPTPALTFALPYMPTYDSTIIYTTLPANVKLNIHGLSSQSHIHQPQVTKGRGLSPHAMLQDMYLKLKKKRTYSGIKSSRMIRICRTVFNIFHSIFFTLPLSPLLPSSSLAMEQQQYERK